MSALAVLDRVTFTYPGMPEPALRDVSVSLDAGAVTGVTGPVGSGASTLLLVTGGFAPRLTGGTLAGTRRLGTERVGIVFATPWTQLTGLSATVRSGKSVSELFAMRT